MRKVYSRRRLISGKGETQACTSSILRSGRSVVHRRRGCRPLRYADRADRGLRAGQSVQPGKRDRCWSSEHRKLRASCSKRPARSTLFVNEKIGCFNANGEIVELPAGALSLAVGRRIPQGLPVLRSRTSRRSRRGRRRSANCQTSRRKPSCLAEHPADFERSRSSTPKPFIPVLRDVVAGEGAELHASVRATPSTPTFGDTTNSKIGMEWRPLDDVLRARHDC